MTVPVGASCDRRRQLIRGGVSLLRREVVKRGAQLLEKRPETLTLLRRSRVLKVDVDAVQTIVLDKLHGVLHEVRARVRRGDELEVTVLRVGVATDGEEDLDRAMLLLDLEKLAEAAVEVVATAGLAVEGDLFVGPRVRELDVTGRRVAVSEGV